MIPVFEPQIGEEEINAVVAALRRGEISGSFGTSIPEFEEKFAAYCGCKYGVAVSNGTTALQLAMAALGIKKGDEVLVSSSTNIASALAVYHQGAVTVPVDSENTTWNLNLDLIESLITERTKVILPVHLYGHPVDMDRLCALAAKHRLQIVEDCAESHGATCRGKMTGSFGQMACFSFYANKIITTGEGGMVTTNNPELAERLRLLRNLGFSEPRFLHQLPGFNFRMTGYQAAMGLAQFSKIDHFIDEKRRVAATYSHFLSEVPGIQPPAEASWAKNVYWMYAIVVKPEFGKSRDELTKFLKENGVESRTFFCPMNQQPFLRDQPGYREVDCPVADSLWRNGLYLPSSVSLKSETIEKICRLIRKASESGVQLK